MPAPHPLLTLEELTFSNRFAALPAHHYTRLTPEGLPDPQLIAGSAAVAELLGLSPDELQRPDFPVMFSGQQMLPGSAPLAAVYSGHQFGVWAGQLGDGRAHLLGGLENTHGHWEIQLKGAGRTPYSRGADGRAVLRSSIREFLCSEAMAGLGIPTTRALSLVGSPLPVRRETWESAAVVSRVAPSFVRFGSFEHWSALDQAAALRQLADHVIDTFRPACREADNPYTALLADVAHRTGELIAQWMSVGFMHGVMNTDNMSILGLTLDYGPFGLMEAFDAGHICNHSDHHGRYSFRNQPAVAQWNLYCLAQAFTPLIGDEERARAAVDDHFGDAFGNAFEQGMRRKLGFRGALADDEAFIGRTFAFLQDQQPDFTLFFRTLSRLPATVDRDKTAETDAPLLDQCIDRAACAAWLLEWRQRQAQTPWPDSERTAEMLAANPKYILRNWLAETAIRSAQTGDFSEVHRLQRCLEHPFAEQPEFEAYAALPPDWARHLEVSCSS